MINRIWSILAAGAPIIEEGYARKVASSAFNIETSFRDDLGLLVPFNDRLFRAYAIEQVTQTLFLSTLKDRALAFDPFNTYEKAVLQYPAAGAFDNSPVEVVHIVLPTAFTDAGQGILQIECSVDPTAKTVTTRFGVSTYTVSNNLSTPVQLFPGFSIIFQGLIPLTPFSFTAEYVSTVSYDWVGTMKKISNKNVQWLDPDIRAIFDNSLNWIDKFSAFALNAIQGSALDV